MSTFKYGVEFLTISKAISIMKGELASVIEDESRGKITETRKRVDRIVQGDQTVYGVNTGFGPLCDTRITLEETDKLQENLLISHAVGVGRPITPELSKLMLICKLQSLSKGYSGIRLEVLEKILEMVKQDQIPVVPCQGSVGASGDLAPLSHLFLPLIRRGELWKEGIPSEVGSNFSTLDLKAKEGLALINGTQFILAHAVLGLDKMQYLLDLADLVGAMSIEGFQGSLSPSHKDLHRLRPFKGNMVVAQRLRTFLEGSENLMSHRHCDRVQDPYSLRCIPQVHGTSRTAIDHLKELTEIELNSVTDNPVFVNSEEIISGGSFHGQPLALALDYATVAAAELGNISDRRCYLLLEGKYGLPRLLIKDGGLNSGLMIPQYTTAALVSENKSLCFPASADSIPTSLGQEDHVSMGSISGRKFLQVIDNLEKILAIELLYASQAMEFRRPLKFSDKLETNLAIVREEVPPVKEDRLLKKDIDRLIQLVKKQKLIVK